MIALSIPARRQLNSMLWTGASAFCAIGVAVVLLLIMGYVVREGLSALSLSFLTQLPRPVGRARRRGRQRHCRHPDHRRHRRADGVSGRNLRRHLSCGLQPSPDGEIAELSRRRSGRGAEHRHRDIRLHLAGRTVSPFLGAFGLLRLRRVDGSAGDPDHRGRGRIGAARTARGGDGARGDGIPRDGQGAAGRRPSRHCYRDCCWRWRGSPAKPRHCCSPPSAASSGNSIRASRWPSCRCRSSPTRSLPTATGTSRHGAAL